MRRVRADDPLGRDVLRRRVAFPEEGGAAVLGVRDERAGETGCTDGATRRDNTQAEEGMSRPETMRAAYSLPTQFKLKWRTRVPTSVNSIHGDSAAHRSTVPLAIASSSTDLRDSWPQLSAGNSWRAGICLRRFAGQVPGKGTTAASSRALVVQLKNSICPPFVQVLDTSIMVNRSRNARSRQWEGHALGCSVRDRLLWQSPLYVNRPRGN